MFLVVSYMANCHINIMEEMGEQVRTEVKVLTV